MWDAESGMIDVWHKYCQRQMRDSYHSLDEKLIFSNMVTTKTDYASKRLPYPLEAGDYSGFDKLISTLYTRQTRETIKSNGLLVLLSQANQRLYRSLWYFMVQQVQVNQPS